MTRLLCFALCLALIPTLGCGSDAPSPDASRDASSPGTVSNGARGADSEAPPSIADALGEALGGNGQAAETVDFCTLRDLLPEELDGMERVDVSGEKTGVAGFSFSQAEGEYRSEDGERRVSLQIVDGGGIGQVAMLGASWLRMDFDRESGDGYEKTTEFEGYPAYEKMRTGAQPRSELQFVVAERFFVSANGQNVVMDELKDAVVEIDLGELEDLRDVGVEQ